MIEYRPAVSSRNRLKVQKRQGPPVAPDRTVTANATSGAGFQEAAELEEGNIYHAILGHKPVDEVILQTQIPFLRMMPSHVDLAGAEVELVNMIAREQKLGGVLEKIGDEFDYIIIDCPPSLGLLTLNALCAADAVLVPLQCEYYALEGLSHLVRTIDRVKRAFNPSLEIQGVVLTMYDRRNNLSDMVAADVREHFGDKVYRTVIPRNVRVSEAPSHGKPVLVYDWRCAGSQAYIHLASEMLRRERKVCA